MTGKPVSLDGRIAKLDKEIAEERRQKKGAGRKRRAYWLARLRSAVEDADAVTRDMLRKPSARGLGPAKHREIYEGAAGAIMHLLDNPPDADEYSDPAGLGGSPAL